MSATQPHASNLPRPAGRARIWLIATWGQLRDAWAIYRQNGLAVAGLVLLVIFTLAAFAHPVLMATVWERPVYDPETGYDMDIFPHPSPPGPGHVLGTDTLGRDVLSMLLAAARPTFTLAIVAALTTAAVSTLVGAVAAAFRGWVDVVIAHIADVALLIPPPLIMVVLGVALDLHPVEFGLIYGVLSGISGAAIVMRSYALGVMNKPYIEASRVAGGGPGHIIFRHLIPHMLPLAATTMMISVVGAVFADGFTAFLGISRIRQNWGNMIYSAFANQRINPTITWNLLIPSALAISLFATAFYLISRGLHEVAEPRARGR